MIDVSALRAEMARNNFTMKDVAKEMGITPKTFSSKLKKGVLGTDEAEILIRILNIQCPEAIFFSQA